MIVAFARGSAQDFDHSGPALPQADTRIILGNASALLRARGTPRAAELSSTMAFEIRRSWNVFEDDFCILYCSLPLIAYEDARKIAESVDGKRAFRELAEVITELGTYIRFVAIDLKMAQITGRSAGDEARALTRVEIDWVARRYVGVNQGYLGDFSYKTHREFYADLGLDIRPDDYPGTTRSRFESILADAPLDVQATILEGILVRYPGGSEEHRMPEAVAKLRSYVTRLRGIGSVAAPTPLVSSVVVERALADAEHLIGKSGATSAVDRTHTALHGYLLKVCADAGLPTTREDSLVTLLRLIREKHPQFANVGGGRSSDITRILKGLGSILDVLSPIRNNASVAHPNEELLEPPEAMLAINTARSILHYVDERLRAQPVDAPDNP